MWGSVYYDVPNGGKLRPPSDLIYSGSTYRSGSSVNKIVCDSCALQIGERAQEAAYDEAPVLLLPRRLRVSSGIDYQNDHQDALSDED